jgi:hypothetical protein
MANNYEVNYDDERFGQVESDKQQALTELEQTYGGMIEESDSYYDAQIEASKQWADTQSQLQQEQTDFAIEQIGQQKDQAHKDYVKEQSGAYVDWQKQSNQYGAEAERQAAAGMNGTGFSESSQVSMFNTYQNRVATARDSYTRAVLNYDNAIKDARLQNNAALAEIAYQALQQQLELSLQGFQYKNNLLLEQANKKVELENTYYNRYMDVLNQINTENALTEEIRQYNQNYELQVKQYEESIRQFDEEIARLKKKDEEEARQKAEQLELEKQQLEQQQKQWEEEMKLKREQLEEEKRQFDLQYKKSTSGGGGSSSNSKKTNNSGTVTKNGSTGNNNRENIADTPSNPTDKPTSNMASILALGYGPISEAKLASLIASGQVTRTLKNGQYYYSKVQPSSTNRLKNMGLSY